jgi:hypothetical protein
MNGESYVVRIYRRDAKKAAQARRSTDRVALDGIVEEVENGGRSSFHGIEELWDCLARRPGRRARKQRE